MAIDTNVFQEFFAVSDRMRVAYYDPESLTVREMIDLSNQLCGQLHSITDTQVNELTEIFRSVQSDPNVIDRQKEILSKASTFMKFLSSEYQILKQCGVSEQLATDVVSSVALVKHKLEPASFETEEFVSSFQTMRDRYCASASEMRQYDSRSTALREMEELYYKGNGLLCGVANGSVIAISLGAAAPFIGLSGLASAYLIREGFNQVDELERRLRR